MGRARARSRRWLLREADVSPQPAMPSRGRQQRSAGRNPRSGSPLHRRGGDPYVTQSQTKTSAPRLDALADVATAELYLHRYAEAGAHAQRGLAIAHATGQGDISPSLDPRAQPRASTYRGASPSLPSFSMEAVDAARLSGNVQALGWNLLSRAFTAIAAGDLELAIRTASKESVKITRDLDDGPRFHIRRRGARNRPGRVRGARSSDRCPRDGSGWRRASPYHLRLETELLRAL